jgi:hypothetical protein
MMMYKSKPRLYKVALLSLALTAMSGCFDSDDDDEPAINTPPVALDIDLITQTETPINETIPATDADGDVLTYAVVTPPALGSVTVANDGSFVYTPDPELTGSDSFTYSASDGEAPAVVGTVNIVIESLEVSVGSYSRNAFNQAPTDVPLPINGRAFTDDVVDQTDYQDLIDGN